MSDFGTNMHSDHFLERSMEADSRAISSLVMAVGIGVAALAVLGSVKTLQRGARALRRPVQKILPRSIGRAP